MRFALRLALPLLAALGVAAAAQQAVIYEDPQAARQALAEAEAQGEAARDRAEQLESQAAEAGIAADQTAKEAAGVAARIQQSEASIAVQQAKIGMIELQRRQLRAELAAKQLPLAGLTASLQRLSRRPPILSLLRPGSLADTVHLRAALATMLPEVERRTAAVRSDIKRAQALQEQARQGIVAMRGSQTELRDKRASLAALETRQRLDSRSVSGIADREAERALALAEQARDLDSLASELDKASELREALAALPGPVLRPDNPGLAQTVEVMPATAAPSGLPVYMLPLAGKLVAGFGDARAGDARSRGISLAAHQGAQAVAPARGRVAFAGPYRGYGSIVIIDHGGGWTSLLTGLVQLDVRVGDSLVAGSPLGIVGAGHPVLTLELRQNGTPVNPLEYVKAL